MLSAEQPPTDGTNSGEAASRTAYDTAPVDRKIKSIRLLRIVNPTHTGSVQCELQAFPLTTAPLYTALSYTWGSAHDTQVIEVNGRPFNVTENLWHFLHQKFTENAREYYWVDAVCIDQSNVEERNHQVGMMRDIYRQASLVNIWLGPETLESKVAMHSLEGFDQDVPEQPVSFSRKIWSAKQGLAVLALCQKPYWRRVWILQEIVLAQKILLCYGTDAMPWTCIDNMLTHLRTTGHHGRTYAFPSTEAILQSDAARTIYLKRTLNMLQFHDGWEAFDYLLDMVHDMSCTETRDLVYGFLGLVDHLTWRTGGTIMTVDYSSPILNLCKEIYDRMENMSKYQGPQGKVILMTKLRKYLKLAPLNETRLPQGSFREFNGGNSRDFDGSGYAAARSRYERSFGMETSEEE